MSSFEAAPAAGYAPHSIYGDVTPNDPREWLPEPAAKKFTSLVQRCHDLHGTIPAHETIREMAKLQTAHQVRIDHLLRHRSEGGAGVGENHASVIDEKKKLARATAERNRLQELSDVRGARWTTAKRLERDVTDFVLRGIPGGCQLAEHEDEPISALLKKGERLSDAISRYQLRLRELLADRHRVRSAPWPSSLAKAAVRAQIKMLAAAPDIDRLVEHNLPVNFVTTVSTALVRGTEVRASVSNETVDFLGLLCWLMPDQIIARIERELDEIADDKAALNEQQRSEMEAQINSDMLMIERSECALIWHAETTGEAVAFREGTNVMALLGVRLVTAPAVNPSPGTSPMHAYDIVGPGRR